MEQIIVVLAVIVYMVFQGAARARRGQGPVEGPPRTPDEEQAEAHERAMEALRRWEQRQRAAAAAPSPEPEPPVARPVPIPSRTRGAEYGQRGVYESAGARLPGAKRGRRESYEAIAGTLARRQPVPPVPEEDVRSLESLVSAEDTPRRLRAPVKGRVVPGERRRVPVPRAARRARQAPPPADSGTAVRRRGASGLRRLEALPPLARAILLAEILGPPASLRGEGSRP
ncbi:MAG: hypothetical protein R6X22_02350 [Gemmatimonadota bacterium]